MSRAPLSDSKETLLQKLEECKREKLNLDLTRGKPSAEQLDLSNEMLTCISGSQIKALDGTDCRNYGLPEGLPEARKFCGDFLETSAPEVIVSGNSSLALMHDTIVGAWLKGVPGSSKPWSQQRVRFLCPVPGYDRHFSILEKLVIEMIAVPMNWDGPDMEIVARLLASDESIKGIWCVPKYSNPTGAVYSPEVVRQLAAVKAKAPDFRIFWDNAYQVHHLGSGPAPLANILDECKKAGNPDRVFLYGSTSKITFASGGIGFVSGSETNIAFLKQMLFYQSVGADKINQLRHLHFFKDMNGVLGHMDKHAKILRPKFDAVLTTLNEELGGTGLCSWTAPEGGYFSSLTLHGVSARRVVKACADMGVKLTAAGATHPYGIDPSDSIIRIAPSFAPTSDVSKAIKVLALQIKCNSIM